LSTHQLSTVFEASWDRSEKPTYPNQACSNLRNDQWILIPKSLKKIQGLLFPENVIKIAERSRLLSSI